MGFQFSLATVLRVRGIVEEREERMLQKILFEITQTIQTLSELNEEIAGSNASRVTGQFKNASGRQIHEAYGHIEELKRRRTEVEGQLGKLEELRDLQVKVYEEARRNREMLTDMRENKREAYLVDTARREQNTLDDNYIARRGRM